MPKKTSIFDQIKPNFIKDEDGTLTGIVLDIKTYNAILLRIKKFAKLKKEIRARNLKENKKPTKK